MKNCSVAERYTEIQISKIDPPSIPVRSKIVGIGELKKSMKVHGLLQPIIVAEKKDGRYEIIAGHRRYIAAKELGWKSIKAVVKKVPEEDIFLLRITENVQREEMTPEEEGRAFYLYTKERGWGSMKRLARMIGKSPAYVSGRIAIFKSGVYSLIPEDIKGKLRSEHFMALMMLKDRPEVVMDTAKAIVKHNMGTKRAKTFCKLLKEGIKFDVALEIVTGKKIKRGKVEKEEQVAMEVAFLLKELDEVRKEREVLMDQLNLKDLKIQYLEDELKTLKKKVGIHTEVDSYCPICRSPLLIRVDYPPLSVKPKKGFIP